MPSDQLSLTHPLVTTRIALQTAFGKVTDPGKKEQAQQNGIVPMRRSDLVCLFSDPQKKDEHGYSCRRRFGRMARTAAAAGGGWEIRFRPPECGDRQP